MTRTAPTMTDPELGEVRYCRKCDEWWPVDEDAEQVFFRKDHNSYKCRGCVSDSKRTRNRGRAA